MYIRSGRGSFIEHIFYNGSGNMFNVLLQRKMKLKVFNSIFLLPLIGPNKRGRIPLQPCQQFRSKYKKMAASMDYCPGGAEFDEDDEFDDGFMFGHDEINGFERSEALNVSVIMLKKRMKMLGNMCNRISSI